MMGIDLVQPAADCFTIGVPAQGIFEPEIDMLTKIKPGVEVGPLIQYDKC